MSVCVDYFLLVVLLPASACSLRPRTTQANSFHCALGLREPTSGMVVLNTALFLFLLFACTRVDETSDRFLVTLFVILLYRLLSIQINN